MSYTCHSGGCPGSDMMWETEGETYGVKTISYSFSNHMCKGKYPKILTMEELKEGYVAAKQADKTLRRGFSKIQYHYIRNLLARNWFQVKNSDVIFAIGMFDGLSIVQGGTGWAVQMAVDSKKPVFVFDQINNRWTTFNYNIGNFEPIDYIPSIPNNFAGIGTRKINNHGIKAVQDIFKFNFEHNK